MSLQPTDSVSCRTKPRLAMCARAQRSCRIVAFWTDRDPSSRYSRLVISWCCHLENDTLLRSQKSDCRRNQYRRLAAARIYQIYPYDGRVGDAACPGETCSPTDEAVRELPPSEHRFIPSLAHDPAANAVGGWQWDAKHDLLSIDPAVALLVHVPTVIHDATASLAKLISIVHAQDRQRLNGAVRRAVMEGEVLCVAFRIIQPSGKLRWILAIGRAAFDDKIDLLSLSGTIINLTEEGRPE